MSIKVTSPRAELAVLRGLTHKNKKIAGTIISNVDSTYFDNPESVEIYDALRKQMGSSGEIPSYKLLIEDPSLSEHARTFFRDSEATIHSIEDAAKATKILNRYRQLRGLYSLASKIDTELQSGKVDLENLMEDASHAVAAIRSKKSSKQAFVHFGRNNSSADLVKDLLYNDSAEDTIPTGIKPFDKESGGLMRGGLFTLGASSGGGKCCSLNTRIQLSTLILELDDGGIMELEPEDTVWIIRSGVPVLLSASLLCESDWIETDPQILQELLSQGSSSIS